jgi:hypothetical protein
LLVAAPVNFATRGLAPPGSGLAMELTRRKLDNRSRRLTCLCPPLFFRPTETMKSCRRCANRILVRWGFASACGERSVRRLRVTVHIPQVWLSRAPAPSSNRVAARTGFGTGDRCQSRLVPDAPEPLDGDTGGVRDPRNLHRGSTACPASIRDMVEFCWDVRQKPEIRWIK